MCPYIRCDNESKIFHQLNKPLISICWDRVKQLLAYNRSRYYVGRGGSRNKKKFKGTQLHSFFNLQPYRNMVKKLKEVLRGISMGLVGVKRT